MDKPLEILYNIKLQYSNDALNLKYLLYCLYGNIHRVCKYFILTTQLP